MPDPVTGVMLGATALGAGSKIMGANNAAKSVTDASNASIDATQHRWDQIIGMFREFYGKGEQALKPYTELGADSANRLQSQMGDLTAPIMMDQETLEKTPGYEWLKTQGMRGVTGQNVLRGLSGAQLKGGADFVKGLADTTYKTQFDIANTNKTNAFNRLFQTTQGGQNAANSLFTTGVTGATNLGGIGANMNKDTVSSLMAAGNAQAGANMVTGNEIGNAIGSAPYAPYMANKLYPNGVSPAASGMYGKETDPLAR